MEQLLLGAEGVAAADGVAFDLGVSSMQLDEAARGFSFRFDGPLDMRMSRDGPTAADLVNELTETELADLIHRYGEERQSPRHRARHRARAQPQAPITRTLALAEIVRAALGPASARMTASIRRPAPSRRCASRSTTSSASSTARPRRRRTLLATGGRLAVVSFHSLEDRQVKRFLRERSGRAGAARAIARMPAARAELCPDRSAAKRHAGAAESAAIRARVRPGCAPPNAPTRPAWGRATGGRA